jgi:hypothetical protein
VSGIIGYRVSASVQIMYHASLHGNSMMVHQLVFKPYFLEGFYSSRWQSKVYSSAADDFRFPDICNKMVSLLRVIRYFIHKKIRLCQTTLNQKIMEETYATLKKMKMWVLGRVIGNAGSNPEPIFAVHIWSHSGTQWILSYMLIRLFFCICL